MKLKMQTLVSAISRERLDGSEAKQLTFIQQKFRKRGSGKVAVWPSVSVR